MELKWTNKALSDLARLHEFLAPVSKPATARTVQALTAAPSGLMANPRIGERLDEFEPRSLRGLRHQVFRLHSLTPSLAMLCSRAGFE